MVQKKIMGVIAITLLIGAASFATAGVPDLSNSTASTAGGAGNVLFNLPNGGGSAFVDASNGDATITLTLLDGLMAPVENYSAVDVWLESGNGTMFACTGGTTADFITNASGVTAWVNPLNAGGWDQTGGTVVSVAGAYLAGAAMDLNHNSADITGDGAVNLTDVPEFAGDFYGAYAFRSDFVFDGVVNLSDVVRLAQALGATCP